MNAGSGLTWALLGVTGVLGKIFYDGTFAFANYVISESPNVDITVWGSLGDAAFNEALGHSSDIKERFETGTISPLHLSYPLLPRYGDKITRGGKLTSRQQEIYFQFFIAKFDPLNPLTGSRFRLFEYVHQMELRMNFKGSKRSGDFVMSAETTDGRWTISKLHAEDSELAIPLEVPYVISRPQQKRPLSAVAAGYPAPPPNLANPAGLNAPHGAPRRPPPPPADSSNTA